MKVRPTIARPQLEADVVVEEEDHRLGGIDQRLEDVGDWNHAGAPWSRARGV